MTTSFPRNDLYIKAREQGHSEEYIREILNYSNVLLSRNLPVIFSTKHLAQLLGLKFHTLQRIISNREDYYSTFRIRKKHGTGTREIQVPMKELKHIQTWINQHILVHVPLHDRCMSFRKGRSIKDNAAVHSGKPMIMQLDFYRFFDTITEQRVYGMFRSLGYHSNLAVDLAKLTTVPPSRNYETFIQKDRNKPADFYVTNSAFLPQGAVTSPLISNIIAKKLDHRLHKLTQAMGSEYTRYADDITISGAKTCLPSMKLIEKIIKEEGFYLNKKKTRYRKTGQRQLVTGLTVTNGVHVPRKLKEEIRQHLYYCKKFGPFVHMQNRGIQSKSAYKDWLLGNICFIHGIEPDVGKKLFAAFSEIDWVL